MFEHPDFDHYEFADVPMNRDIFLLDAKDMAAYERDWMKVFGGGPYDPTVLVSYVGVRSRAEVSLELSWYPNVNTRFHEVKVSLPKTASFDVSDVAGGTVSPPSSFIATGFASCTCERIRSSPSSMR